jgi:hypothetical protein
MGAQKTGRVRREEKSGLKTLKTYQKKGEREAVIIGTLLAWRKR